uniref:Enterohemolysin 2 n=1 Tax=Escherichia coli TaxID=562 RepID=P71212_ECOLX|nr:unnamed protein product [Escherichia coli]
MTRMFFPINRSSSLYRLRMYAFSLCNFALRFSEASSNACLSRSASSSSATWHSLSIRLFSAASSSTRSFPTVRAISSFFWSRRLMYCWFLSRSSSSASTVSGPVRNLKALSASISTP